MTSMASLLDISAAVAAPDSPADGPVQKPPVGRGTGRGRGRGRGAGRGRGRVPNPQPLVPGSPEFRYTQLRPLDTELDRLLLLLMRSGSYVPAAQWAMTRDGNGLVFSQACISALSSSTLLEHFGTFFWNMHTLHIVVAIAVAVAVAVTFMSIHAAAKGFIHIDRLLSCL